MRRGFSTFLSTFSVLCTMTFSSYAAGDDADRPGSVIEAAGYTLDTVYHTDERETPKLQFVLDAGPAKTSNPTEEAWTFLRTFANTYSLPSDLSNLRLESTKESILGTHFYFQQYIDSVPVDQGEIIVSVRHDDGTVYRVFNNTYPETKRALKISKVGISSTRAYDIAWADLKVRGDLSAKPQVKRVYIPEGSNFRLVYMTYLEVQAPMGAWEHVIDVESGKIISMRNTAIEEQKMDLKAVRHKMIDQYKGPVLKREEAFASFNQKSEEKTSFFSTQDAWKAAGSGYVFDPDPRTTLKDATLQDDSPAARFEAAYFTKQLFDISYDGKVYALNGPWAKIIDFESPATAPSTTTDGRWTAKRGNNAFNDVMTYFHIDQNQRYMQSLGYTGSRGIQFGSIEVDSDGLNGDDNSHFIPSSNRLAFGHGCVDDNEDADVILHEYGHAIQFSINRNWSGGDTGAMGEGFGDYWAATYSLTAPNGAEYDIQGVFNWDARGEGNKCWPGRNLNAFAAKYDPTRTYAAHVSIEGGFVSDELWSTPLYQSRLRLKELGHTREEIDRLILESHFGLGSGLKIREMAKVIVDTSERLYPGTQVKSVFLGNFVSHNMLEVPQAALGAKAPRLINAGTNNVADPGETVGLYVPIMNSGALEAKGIQAKLTTTTPLVSIGNGVTTYPDIATGAATENASPFSIAVAPSFKCGDVMKLTLDLSFDGGPITQKKFDIDLGTGVAVKVEKGTEPNLAIPDNSAAGITSNVTIEGATGNVTTNFQLTIDIAHPYIGDLKVTLESPRGTKVQLHSKTGGNTDNIVGTYPTTLTPAESLSKLVGEPLNGQWKLIVSDNANGDKGTLKKWIIQDVAKFECN